MSQVDVRGSASLCTISLSPGLYASSSSRTTANYPLLPSNQHLLSQLIGFSAMDTHTEEEEKVDDTMVLGADNPHAYLFGGDPIEPSEPETYSAPPVVERELPPPPQQSLKPSSPKQIVAPPVLSAPKATSEIKRTVKAGEFDERFKATVEYVNNGTRWRIRPKQGQLCTVRALQGGNAIFGLVVAPMAM